VLKSWTGCGPGTHAELMAWNQGLELLPGALRRFLAMEVKALGRELKESRRRTLSRHLRDILDMRRLRNPALDGT